MNSQDNVVHLVYSVLRIVQFPTLDIIIHVNTNPSVVLHISNGTLIADPLRKQLNLQVMQSFMATNEKAGVLTH